STASTANGARNGARGAVRYPADLRARPIDRIYGVASRAACGSRAGPSATAATIWEIDQGELSGGHEINERIHASTEEIVTLVTGPHRRYATAVDTSRNGRTNSADPRERGCSAAD